MICFDTPRVWKASLGPSSHLVSNLPGEEGTKELIEFAVSIGLRRSYIQNRGTTHEHFDIWRGSLQRAQEAGATMIDWRQLVAIFKEKEKTMPRRADLVRRRRA